MSANWELYFECRNILIDGKPIKNYAYKDKSVVKLPANLPMPPTDTFYYMFDGCSKLQDISALTNWNVSNVKDMRCMFDKCHQLKDISALANWDVSNVKNMRAMFYNCHQLQDITALANWNVSNVKDMGWMFYNCYKLQNITALANWDVSKVGNMDYMFSVCNQLQDISALANWDVSNVEDMHCMFEGCRQLQDISALADWGVSNVGNMYAMFYECEQLNIPSDSEDVKSYLHDLPKQDHTQLLDSLWERIKPLLKDTTKLNGYFKRYDKRYIHVEDLPSDWQNVGLIQWNP